MNEMDRCRDCHHQRREHYHEGGSCTHFSGDRSDPVLCTCQKFRPEPIPDRFNPVPWRP